MSTPPIRIPITAQDLTGPAFVSAGSKAQAFQSATSGSMVNAMGSARLLNAELDLGLNRTLVRLMAHSALLGPALSAALPVAAAIGFGLAINKIYEHLSGANSEAKKFAENASLAESFHKIAESVAKINSEMKEIGKSAKQVALDAAAEAQFRLVNAQLAAQQQAAIARSVGATARRGVSPLAGGRTEVQTGVPGTSSAVDADIAMAAAMQDQARLTTERLSELQAAFNLALAKFQKASADEAAKGLEKAERNAERLNAILEKMKANWLNQDLLKDFTKGPVWLEKISHDLPEQIGPYFAGGTAVAAIPSADVASKYLQHFRDIQGVIEATRTGSERYAAEVERLNTLFGEADRNSEVYRRALDQIAQKYDQNAQAWRQFGVGVQESILAATTFQESWSQALQQVAQELIKLTLRMYVFSALESRFGGGSGAAGSFLSGLFGSMTHHAGGGYVPPGQWGWAGEEGPEPIFGGRTGLTVIPHGAGGSVNYYIDARGADASVEQRIMRMLPAIENRAVQRAVRTMDERNMRR